MNAPHEPAVAAAAQTPVTLADAVGQYLAVYAVPESLGGIGGRDANRPRYLAAWVRIMGNKPLAAISCDDVEEGLRQIAAVPNRVYAGKDADGQRVFRKRGTGRRSNATVNRHHIGLAGLYSWARKQRLLPRDFVSPTRHVEKLPEPRGRVRYLSESERERLLTACKGASWPRLYLLTLLAMTTGGRRGELLGLRWCDIDTDRGEATLHDTKNGERRVLVLLQQVLDEMAKFAPADAPASTALVFRSRLRPSQPFSFKSAWTEAMNQAGIKDFHFHDLRHTCASYAAQQGASLLELADLLGHKTMLMVRRYSHLSTDSKRRLVARTFEGRL